MEEVDEGFALAGLAPLLWAAGVVVLMLAYQAALGYVRRCRRARRAFGRWALIAVATVMLSGGTFAAALLAMATQPLAYAVGYFAPGLVGAFAVAAAAALLALVVVTQWPGAAGALVAGVLQGTGAAAVLVLLVQSLGLAPGPRWQPGALAATAALAAAGSALAFWFIDAAVRLKRRRRAARWGAACAGALLAALGNEVGFGSVGLQAQVASEWARAVPLVATALVAGMLVPMLLLAGLGELKLRRYADAGPAVPEAKRRRRRRVRLIG